MTDNVVHFAEYRANRRPLDDALKAIERHPRLKDIDKAAIAALARYATDAGFFNLDQRERSAVTGLRKFPLMSALARVKKVELLHKANPYGPHKIGEVPTPDHVRKAERLFRVLTGLVLLGFTLKDTHSYGYEASWLVPKIWFPGEKLSERELVTAVRELDRLGYLVVAEIDEGDSGGARIRYLPARYDNFRQRRDRGGK